ncbi:MAG TPA: hypothetical protein DHM44_10070 [Flexistipes sinusarabici]|uniref:Uncharacterized protein n=1 Tax=Flexistipes sinusarabici TaxID=2352 RepID=A0A3D5QDV0_FLESI|nr:hypothetical protein [Flexistipes sinusarabici]
MTYIVIIDPLVCGEKSLLLFGKRPLRFGRGDILCHFDELQIGSEEKSHTLFGKISLDYARDDRKLFFQPAPST